jgi:hypothetical protein
MLYCDNHDDEIMDVDVLGSRVIVACPNETHRHLLSFYAACHSQHRAKPCLLSFGQFHDPACECPVKKDEALDLWKLELNVNDLLEHPPTPTRNKTKKPSIR